MKNESISVSIVVPVYNAAQYLKKCLDSIVNQTLTNIEIIIIDDGSTDGSTEICKKYAAKDSRIIYYKKENEGLAAARQDGIERASGEYVGFVDSDDWLELNMYERMFSVAKENNADVVFCNCFFNDSGRDKIYLTPGIYDRERVEKEILPRTLAGISEKGSNSVIRWSNCLRMYSLALIKENGISFGRGFRRSQDLQLTFETALCAQKYVSINDEPLYHNRTEGNAGSLSRGYTKNYWKLIRPLIDKLYEDVAGYKKQDLSYYMHLCTFFFAVNGVQNEYEKSTFSFVKKLRMLDEVVKDEAVQNALKYVEYNKLNNYYKMIYFGLKGGSSLSIVYNYAKHNLHYNFYNPLVRILANNKLVNKIYSFLKRKGAENGE